MTAPLLRWRTGSGKVNAMKKVGLFLLAVVMVTAIAGCESDNYEREFNMNGTWRVTSLEVRSNCPLDSQWTRELEIVQEDASLSFGKCPGHFDTATGVFSAKCWFGSLGPWYPWYPWEMNQVYVEFRGNMTSDESFHAIETYTGACQATFDMSGDLLPRASAPLPGELAAKESN